MISGLGECEIALRIIGFPLQKIGWKSTAGAHELNRLEFRGQDIETVTGDYVVILLGDSQVESLATSFDRMPEKRLQLQLQKKLNRSVKVLSIGAAGYGQDQELMALDDYFEQGGKADMVINWITFNNDIWNNTFPTHFGKTPKPTFELKKGRLKFPDEKPGEFYPPSTSRLLHLVERVLVRRVWGRDEQWEKILPPAGPPCPEKQRKARTDWQEQQDLGYRAEENFINEKTHFSVFLEPRSPRVQYGLDLTRALLLQMENLCARSGAQFIVFSTDVSHLYLGEDPQYQRFRGRVYKISRRQLIENFEYLIKGFQTIVVPIRIREWAVGPTNRHLNDAGVADVMEGLATQIALRLQESQQVLKK